METLGTRAQAESDLRAVAALRRSAEVKIANELVHNGMDAASAARVARERIEAGLVKVPRESGPEIGFLSQVVEGGLAAAERFGFGAGTALEAGTKAAGAKAPSSQLGAAARKPEAAAEKGLEQAGANLPSFVSGIVALIGAYGPRLLEVIAGGALMLFGLATLARGGHSPSLPGLA